jgi:hypothetical protein
MQNNKGRRHELKMLHYKRRLKNYRISKEQADNPKNNFFAFRSHGKPCSCWCCRRPKYNRAKEKNKFGSLKIMMLS